MFVGGLGVLVHIIGVFVGALEVGQPVSVAGEVLLTANVAVDRPAVVEAGTVAFGVRVGSRVGAFSGVPVSRHAVPAFHQ